MSKRVCFEAFRFQIRYTFRQQRFQEDYFISEYYAVDSGRSSKMPNKYGKMYVEKLKENLSFS